MSRPANDKQVRTAGAVFASVRSCWLPLVLALGFTGGLLLAAAVYGYLRGIPPSDLTRDAVAVTGTSAHVGNLSNLGVLLWWGSAVVCLVTGWLLHRWRRPGSATFVGAGLLGGALAVDDLLVVHEKILPSLWTGLGGVLLSSYVLLVALYVWVNRRLIRDTEWPLLGAAVLLLGASLGVDEIGEASGAEPYFVEDALKLLGIACWSLYFVRTSLRQLAVSTPPSSLAATSRGAARRGS